MSFEIDCRFLAVTHVYALLYFLLSMSLELSLIPNHKNELTYDREKKLLRGSDNDYQKSVKCLARVSYKESVIEKNNVFKSLAWF